MASQTSSPPSLDLPPDPFAPAPRSKTWEAVRRNPWVVIIPALLFALAGVALAYARDTTYRAETRMAVGPIDVSSPSLPALVNASAALSAVYSRAIDADGVTAPTARQLDIDQVQVRERLSASPVAESPVLRVWATGKTDEGAIRLANIGSRNLRLYARELNAGAEPGTRARSASLLARYRRAALRTERLRLARDDALAAYEAAPSPRGLNRVQRREAALSTAQLRSEDLRAGYRREQDRLRVSGDLLRTLTPAFAATSNKRSRMQLYGAAGLLLGAGLGLVLAARRGRLD
jgi:hypothetical protein